MQRLFFLFAIIFATLWISNAAETNDVRITVAKNPWIDASFVRKAKTKYEGWVIYVRFTNKTKKPMFGLSTSFDLLEGGWKIGSNNYFSSGSSVLIAPGESRVVAWMAQVPSSVDTIHIYGVVPEFENFSKSPPKKIGPSINHNSFQKSSFHPRFTPQSEIWNL